MPDPTPCRFCGALPRGDGQPCCTDPDGYRGEFPADCHPPREWIAAIETQGARDHSWRNDAAPSWIMDSGANHVTRFFYLTADNGDNVSKETHVEILTEFHERPEECYVCSPDAALTLARAIAAYGAEGFPTALAYAEGAGATFTDEETFWARYSRDVTDNGL